MIVADIEITEPWVIFEGEGLPPEEGLSLRKAETLYDCEIYLNGFRIGRLAAPIDMGFDDYSLYDIFVPSSVAITRSLRKYHLKVLLEPQHTRAPT